ncbi:MAG: redoxin domain-containing protein [Chitinophagales bacterium]|nr:redoxin domain-containing protein [Chitinophagales bacterium]
MKARFLTLVILIMASSFVFGQTLHNFTVTDVTGQTHRLYEDYLNNNKVVVIKFFFTTCPPCIANAPYFQQKYIDYGAGAQDVEFFSVTTIPTDFDPEVIAFEHKYDQTMKGISVDGGALALSYEFKDGIYGSWYGTPSFVVIAPDRTMQYPVFFNDIDQAISIARSKKIQVSTTYHFTPELHALAPDPDDAIQFYLKPKHSDSPQIEILKNSQNQYTFNYPSDEYPSMQDPVVIMKSNAEAYTSDISALDIVIIQRHILGLGLLSQDYQVAAADVNGDQRLTASDLTVLRKVILGYFTEFPNNVPSYKAIPEVTSITPSPGQTIELKIDIVKTGNVN